MLSMKHKDFIEKYVYFSPIALAEEPIKLEPIKRWEFIQIFGFKFF